MQGSPHSDLPLDARCIRSCPRSLSLETQIRSTLLETVERAFAFYDEDNSNSIDATELVNILRALGHDPTRGEVRALLRKADADRDGTVQVSEIGVHPLPLNILFPFRRR